MTEMELIDGGDNTQFVPAAGNAKVVPVNYGEYDDVDFGAPEVQLIGKNGVCVDNGVKNEKIGNGYETKNISERFGHEKIAANQVESFECSSDDNHEEMKEEVILESSDIDFSSEILKSEIDDREYSQAAERVDGDSMESEGNDEEVAVGTKINGGELQIVVPPHSQLPKPEAPPGLMLDRSKSLPESGSVVKMPPIGKFFREKSNSLSSSISKGISSIKDESEKLRFRSVTEINLSGLKVIVKSKDSNEDDERAKLDFKGQISFFSKSNCRDCTAVRSFFRERSLKYVEINIDVFPAREKELIERTGSSSVPQIFLNEKLFGGLVVLNSLRNSGMLEDKLKELLYKKCPANAPAPPVYGFDDPEEERLDELLGIVRVLRQKLPIQDRLMKMKMIRNCFSGAEMVEIIMKHYLGCDRVKAVEIGKQLVRKHFVHHVFGENEFEDGNHYYRFLEHEPFISKCFNFRGSINDSEPKDTAMVGQRLAKLMSAILESYASDDRQHLDYAAISNSEEFRRYVNLVQDLHRVNLHSLSADEKLAFFLNLFNAMVVHAVIRIGHPGGVVDRRSLNSDFLYVIGGHPYSLNAIKNGILRGNRRAPYSLVKPFRAGDKRLELAFAKVNPSIHFGLCNGTRSSPTVRFFTPQGVESELRQAAREFFQINGIEVDLAKRTVHLTRIFKWFDMDFGQEKEILRWTMKYLDASKAGLLTHLLGDGGAVNVVYQNYDWSPNC